MEQKDLIAFKLKDIFLIPEINNRIINLYEITEVKINSFMSNLPESNNMLIGSGDHVHQGISNIREFDMFNIYVCYPEFTTEDASDILQNLKDLLDYPNKYIVFMDISDENHLMNLSLIFENKINLLDRHSNSPSLPINTINKILINGGNAINMYPVDNSFVMISYNDIIKPIDIDKKNLSEEDYLFLLDKFTRFKRIIDGNIIELMDKNVNKLSILNHFVNIINFIPINSKKLKLNKNWLLMQDRSFKNNLDAKIKFYQKIIKFILYSNDIPNDLIGTITYSNHPWNSPPFLDLKLLKNPVEQIGGSTYYKKKYNKKNKKNKISKKRTYNKISIKKISRKINNLH